MRSLGYIVGVASLLTMVACGGGVKSSHITTPDTSATVEPIDYDSVYRRLDERYNALAEERSAALEEPDADIRRQRLEANDSASEAFRVELQRTLAAEQEQLLRLKQR